MRNVQITTSERIQSMSMANLCGSTNMSASSTSGTQMSAAKPRLTSTGYMSSNLAALSRNVALYSPEFMMTFTIVARRKRVWPAASRSVIMRSVSASLRSNSVLMLSRCLR